MSAGSLPDSALPVSALHAVAPLYPTVDAAVAEAACLSARLELPKGVVHVISDIHGEDRKLQHILNNASGSLRPLVEELFGERLSAAERDRLLGAIYYPAEMFAHLGLAAAPPRVRAGFVREMLRQQFGVLAALTRHFSLVDAREAFPPAYATIFGELLLDSLSPRPTRYIDTMLDTLTERGRGLEAVLLASELIRRLSVAELVVAGDMGDRGPRIDRVIDLLMRQPNVAVVWGNHDMSWMGAALGHEACIATVLRLSTRFNRLPQVEEGYGISVEPLEKLAREVYGKDPAPRFQPQNDGLRDAALMARMQKAIAVIQFKLEAQAIARHPEFHMADRALIERIDLRRGTVRLDGREVPLADRVFPTLDPSGPSVVLSPEETECMEHLRGSFRGSRILAEQMSFLVAQGAAYLVRDGHLIFHGCVPIDEAGAFLRLRVDGELLAGRALLEKIDAVVRRAHRSAGSGADAAEGLPSALRSDDLDLLWYLWTGPLSPMFGKDRMATFESYFIEDEATHQEQKNPYFPALDRREFCGRVLAEFGVDPDCGMIVNGHLPVRVEKGERPLKASGMAITIDGAFSESLGDRGYTLILAHDGTRLAEHHHFGSVEEALTKGGDIIPTVQEIQRFDPPRRVADTDLAPLLRGEIVLLDRLAEAYGHGAIREQRSR